MKYIIPFLFLFVVFSGCGKDGDSSTSSTSTTGKGGSLARFVTTPTHLYTVSDRDLKSYDITTATNPVYQSTKNLGFDVETIFWKDQNLFIGTQTGMRIMDIKDPDAPNQVSSFSHIRSCDPVVANDKYAFITLRTNNTCTRGLSELEVLDISNLNSPFLLKSVAMNEPKGLAIDGKNLFVCDGGVKQYDISDPKNPVFIRKVVADATDVIANNGVLMVIGTNGLYQYDYSKGNLDFLSKITVQ